MTDPRFKAKAELTDWPEGFVDQCRENYEAQGSELSKERLLALLANGHGEMRFGEYIDLNMQQGLYLRPGNGVVDRPQGSDSGFVIGALEQPYVEVHNTGQAEWWAIGQQDRYVSDGEAQLTWVLANAGGPWFLTTEFQQSTYEPWYALVLHFLNVADEAAFVAAFRKDEA